MTGQGLDMKDYVSNTHAIDRVCEADGFTLHNGLIPQDRYTGEPLLFRLEQDRADWQVDIDHIVSLADVYRSGGWRWSVTGTNWLSVANHPGNLLPTACQVNRSKGDKTAA